MEEFTGFPKQRLFVNGICWSFENGSCCGLQQIIEIGYRVVFCRLDFTSTLTHSSAFNFQVLL